ncbi:hypothetical protein BDV97DRAFT_346131 [Delphinella strobiligena]|nr:hypothetical protein BDV97DRAFT_346131 [Delphinella strobiligena]
MLTPPRVNSVHGPLVTFSCGQQNLEVEAARFDQGKACDCQMLRYQPPILHMSVSYGQA